MYMYVDIFTGYSDQFRYLQNIWDGRGSDSVGGRTDVRWASDLSLRNLPDNARGV